MKNLKEKYLPQILSLLKKVNPKLIILFGSYSHGKSSEDSDLDLLVVLNSNRIPRTYDEKLELKLSVRKIIRSINKKIPIDLLVFTIPEYEEFLKSNSSFSKEIIESGKVLYEAAS